MYSTCHLEGDLVELLAFYFSLLVSGVCPLCYLHYSCLKTVILRTLVYPPNVETLIDRRMFISVTTHCISVCMSFLEKKKVFNFSKYKTFLHCSKLAK